MGIYLILFVGLGAMYFFTMKNQKKQQQERQDQLNSMSPGDEIVTIGGLHGVLSEINEQDRTVTLDCEGIYLVFDKSAVKSVSPKTEVVVDDTVTEVIEEEPAVEPKEQNED